MTFDPTSITPRARLFEYIRQQNAVSSHNTRAQQAANQDAIADFQRAALRSLARPAP